MAKKDVNKVKGEISRLEHLGTCIFAQLYQQLPHVDFFLYMIASSGQLSKQDQARLDNLKAEASKIEKAKKVKGIKSSTMQF